MKPFRSDWKMPRIGEGRREGSEPGGTEKGRVFNKRDGVLGGGEGSGNQGESAGRGQEGRRKKNSAFEETVRKEERDEGPYLQCGRGEQVHSSFYDNEHF